LKKPLQMHIKHQVMKLLQILSPKEGSMSRQFLRPLKLAHFIRHDTDLQVHYIP